MSAPWTMFLGSALVMGILIVLLVWGLGTHPGKSGKPPLFVYCGAGIRAPVETAAKEYERDYGVPFIFQYGPSQTLAVQAELSGKGDLYLPGDDDYIEIARKKDLIEQSVPLARMRPVLAVRKGNPKNIRALDDLLRSDVRLAQPSPEAAAAGRLVHNALEKSGQWKQIRGNTSVFKGTVNEIVTDLKVDAADAGFVWDVLVKQDPQLEIVPLPQLAEARALVAVALLKSSTQTRVAQHFIRYLAARDKGLRMFKEHGFERADGDEWREHE